MKRFLASALLITLVFGTLDIKSFASEESEEGE